MEKIFKLKNPEKLYKTIFLTFSIAISSLLLGITIFNHNLPKDTPEVLGVATQNYYIESTASSTWATNTTYQDKAVLTFTPDDNSTYVIIASWIMGESSTSYQSKAKLTRTTGTAKDFNEIIYAPKATTDLIAAGTFGIDTFGSAPGSQTYKIQYGTSSTSGTASIRQAKIIAIKLTTLDQNNLAETRTTNNTTTYVDKNTLTFTPATAGDYIILATGTIDESNTSGNVITQMTVDGTAYSNEILYPSATANRYPWITVKKVTLTQASHTIKTQFKSSSASYTSGMAHARIVAIRADRFMKYYYNEAETRVTSTSTSYQTALTLTATPNAQPHLIIGTSGLDGSSASYNTYGQLLKGATTYGEMLVRTTNASTRGISYFNISKETLTNASTSWYLQYKSSSTSGTAGSANNRILVLELTEPGITVGATGTQTANIQAGTTNQYLGGAFTLVREAATSNVTSITVSETGTIADANITNLDLYYKQEASCSATMPSGTTLFNSTPGTFSSGSSTVTGTIPVGTSQICVYAQADIGSGASNGDTVEIQITNPSTQVVSSFGTVSPATAVAISGTTTITSNTAPSFTAINSNSPQYPGNTLTWTTTASDPDSDTVKLLVCKTTGVSAGACDGGAGDTWCSSSLVASNPTCSYSIPLPSPDGVNNAYEYIVDEHNLEATYSYSLSFTIDNATPVVSAVTINGGAAINLLENTTKAVALTATVTDNNSCYGGEIVSVKANVYRSGITPSGCDTIGEANDNYCYPDITCTVVGGTCTDITDASADYTCTANIQYFADPTDAGTLYPSENWTTRIYATDNASAGYSTATGVEMNSLIAFNVTPAINFGSLSVGQSNDPLDKTIIVTPTGNVGLDEELSGPAYMCTDYPTCSGAKISIGNQKYSLSSSTAFSAAYALLTTATEVELNVPKPINTSPTTKSIWWGMLIPSNTSAGTYNSTTTITGIKGETTSW
jgi:hypothetical protein